MGAGLLQLVAYGIPDLFLTSDPQITFFKTIYRRYTNFSVESIPEFFSTNADFGSQVTCNICRQGDLLHKVYVVVNLPAIPSFCSNNKVVSEITKKFAWVRYLGYALIKEVTIEINSKIIDRQYGEWLYIWEELSGKHMGNGKATDKMTGNVPELYEFSDGKDAYTLFIPLQFWFCRSVGLSLPLIALTNSEIKINVSFTPLSNCYIVTPANSIEILEDIAPFKPGDYINQTVGTNTINGIFSGFDYINRRLYYIKIQNNNNKLRSFSSLSETNSSSVILTNPDYSNNIPYRIYSGTNYVTPTPNVIEQIESINLTPPKFIDSYLLIDYVYLDSDERLKFARANHEYLIEQLQMKEQVSVNSSNIQINIGFNHPIKEFIWVCQLDEFVGKGTINDSFNFTDSFRRDDNGELTGKNIILNGNLLLNGTGRFGQRDSDYFNLVQPYQHHHRGAAPGINCYSFSLNPEKHQPSSTCNMSKIDYISLQLSLMPQMSSVKTGKIRVYAYGYNLLRILSGLGGLAFTTY